MIKRATKTIYVCDESGLEVESDTLPTGWCRVNEKVNGQGVLMEDEAIHLSSKKFLKDYLTKDKDKKEQKTIEKYYK